MKTKRSPIERVSLTMPRSTLEQLDVMAAKRGFASRSQAVNEIVHRELIEYNEHVGDQVMTGTITFFYDSQKQGLANRLNRIQREHIAEVISSLHVQLENGYTMEVLLVQGPACVLRGIADKLIACKGVTTGKLSLTHTIMPPIHAPGG